MTNLIRIVLCIFLLICLLDMPYGYFQLVRFGTMILSLFFAYQTLEKKQPVLTILYVSVAILFNPLVKIALGRTIWNVVDVAYAVFLIAMVFIEMRQPPGQSEEQ